MTDHKLEKETVKSMRAEMQAAKDGIDFDIATHMAAFEFTQEQQNDVYTYFLWNWISLNKLDVVLATQEEVFRLTSMTYVATLNKIAEMMKGPVDEAVALMADEVTTETTVGEEVTQKEINDITQEEVDDVKESCIPNN